MDTAPLVSGPILIRDFTSVNRTASSLVGINR